MKNKTLISNLLLAFSFAFFLFASAFTLIPEYEIIDYEKIETIENIESNEYAEVAMLGCKTCGFSGGSPSRCETAEFCGVTKCTGSCNMSGGLCGPDCGLD